MIGFNVTYLKCQAIAGDTSANTLIQIKQDINTGYHLLNAAIARYFTRKQQFTNIVSGQQLYQTPPDMIRPTEVSVIWSTGFEYPLQEIVAEDIWRKANIYNQSSMPTSYFVYGNNQIGLFPKPSQSVTNGLRLVYQPQDVDLIKDDYITGTVSITNGATTVTGSGTTWTSPAHKGMFLSVTDGSGGNWYQIDTVSSNTSLALITPYADPTVSNATYKLSQMFIFPGEYSDVPVDYAMGRYFEAKNNPSRAEYHMNRFDNMVKKAVEDYASSSTSNVITDSDPILSSNPFSWPPMSS